MRPSLRSEAGNENCAGHKLFISGIFFTGPPYQILKAWRDGRVQLLVSPSILDEYQRIGAELALQFRDVDLKAFLDLLTVFQIIIKNKIIFTILFFGIDTNYFLYYLVNVFSFLQEVKLLETAIYQERVFEHKILTFFLKI